jgi:hypothetical protein
MKLHVFSTEIQRAYIIHIWNGRKKAAVTNNISIIIHIAPHKMYWNLQLKQNFSKHNELLCGRVVRVPGYRSRGPDSIPSTASFSEMYWVWNGVHSASLSTSEELLEIKISSSSLKNLHYSHRGSLNSLLNLKDKHIPKTIVW